jgi:hypothetical protein
MHEGLFILSFLRNFIAILAFISLIYVLCDTISNRVTNYILGFIHYGMKYIFIFITILSVLLLLIEYKEYIALYL